MSNTINFNDIIDKLASLGEAHVDIKTHYRWNLSEFFSPNAPLRDGSDVTLMTYESPTVIPENTETRIHLGYNCAFNILGKPGVETYEVDNEAAQNEVLHHCLEIALEFYRKLIEDASIPFLEDNVTPNKWHAVLKKLSFNFTKIGPITANSLYGYRCEFVVNPKFNQKTTASKWVN